MSREITLRKDREDDRAQLKRFIDRLAPDKAWSVAVKEYRPRRSNQQNAYLWGYVYETICKHFEGWRPDDVHEYMLGERFGWEDVDTMDGPMRVPIRRSSRLSKMEFVDFIAFIQQRAGEHGINIEDPAYPEVEG